MARFALLALCLAPAASVVYFEETFDDASWTSRWVESTEWKPAGEMGKWELTPGAWYDEAAKDVAMGEIIALAEGFAWLSPQHDPGE